MLHTLRNGLGCQVPFDEDFEDVASVLFLGNRINSRLKTSERQQVFEYALPTPNYAETLSTYP